MEQDLFTRPDDQKRCKYQKQQRQRQTADEGRVRHGLPKRRRRARQLPSQLLPTLLGTRCFGRLTAGHVHRLPAVRGGFVPGSSPGPWAVARAAMVRANTLGWQQAFIQERVLGDDTGPFDSGVGLDTIAACSESSLQLSDLSSRRRGVRPSRIHRWRRHLVSRIRMRNASSRGRPCSRPSWV